MCHLSGCVHVHGGVGRGEREVWGRGDWIHVFKRSLWPLCLTGLWGVRLQAGTPGRRQPQWCWGDAGEGIVCPLQDSWASLVAQLVENPPAMQETWVQSLGCEDPLEKEMATHSCLLAWEVSQTEEMDRLWYMGSQRVRYDLASKLQQECHLGGTTHYILISILTILSLEIHFYI